MQIELPISMGNSCNYCEQYTALPAEYKMPKVIKLSNPFTYVCWVSVLTTFSAPPQILAASTVFFCPIPETKKWWVMVSFWCYCCRFVWNSKRLLSTSCNSRASSSEQYFFHGVIPDAFWSSQNRMCRKLNKPLNNELKFHIVNIY